MKRCLMRLNSIFYGKVLAEVEIFSDVMRTYASGRKVRQPVAWLWRYELCKPFKGEENQRKKFYKDIEELNQRLRKVSRKPDPPNSGWHDTLEGQAFLQILIFRSWADLQGVCAWLDKTARRTNEIRPKAAHRESPCPTRYKHWIFT